MDSVTFIIFVIRLIWVLVPFFDALLETCLGCLLSSRMLSLARSMHRFTNLPARQGQEVIKSSYPNDENPNFCSNPSVADATPITATSSPIRSPATRSCCPRTGSLSLLATNEKNMSDTKQARGFASDNFETSTKVPSSITPVTFNLGCPSNVASSFEALCPVGCSTAQTPPITPVKTSTAIKKLRTGRNMSDASVTSTYPSSALSFTTTSSSPTGSAHSTATTPPTTSSSSGSAQTNPRQPLTVIHMSAGALAALLREHMTDCASSSPHSRVSEEHAGPRQVWGHITSPVSARNDLQPGIHAYKPDRDMLAALISAERDDSDSKHDAASHVETDEAPFAADVDHSFDPQFLPCHKNFYKQRVRVANRKARTGCNGRKTKAKANKNALTSSEELKRAAGPGDDRCEEGLENTTDLHIANKEPLALPSSVVQTSSKVVIVSEHDTDTPVHYKEHRLSTVTSPATAEDSSCGETELDAIQDTVTAASELFLNSTTRLLLEGVQKSGRNLFADDSRNLESSQILESSAPACFVQHASDHTCCNKAETSDDCLEDCFSNHDIVEEARSVCAHKPTVVNSRANEGRPLASEIRFENSEMANGPASRDVCPVADDKTEPFDIETFAHKLLARSVEEKAAHEAILITAMGPGAYWKTRCWGDSGYVNPRHLKPWYLQPFAYEDERCSVTRKRGDTDSDRREEVLRVFRKYGI